MMYWKAKCDNDIFFFCQLYDTQECEEHDLVVNRDLEFHKHEALLEPRVYCKPTYLPLQGVRLHTHHLPQTPLVGYTGQRHGLAGNVRSTY